ncbi:MAG: hypothetical protein HY744_05805 [Deltaproteobacteria bacterium]|nr:hypothetical protein [Deltaproteobacteria bacterium]
MTDRTHLEAKERECQAIRAELAELAAERAREDFEGQPDKKDAYVEEEARLEAALKCCEEESKMLLAEYERDQLAARLEEQRQRAEAGAYPTWAWVRSCHGYAASRTSAL